MYALTPSDRIILTLQTSCCPSRLCPVDWPCCGQDGCYPKGGACCGYVFMFCSNINYTDKAVMLVSVHQSGDVAAIKVIAILLRISNAARKYS